MKVKDLIEKLQKLDPELDVFTSIDDEGNGYRSLNSEPCTGSINPADLRYGQSDAFYFDEWSDDQCGLEAGERDDFIKAVCLG